ncbi:MAG: chloride channel protein [Candidatus Lokiarchaeota archaeon]|nr:chloride channel protein [Candidatus Lokiarchaeota archaeon]
MLSSVMGIICGIVMVGFNYLLIFFKWCFSFVPYFFSPIIAGAMTSFIVRAWQKRKMNRIMGTGGVEYIEEVNKSEGDYDRLPILIGKTFATSWTFGSGMLCGKEGPGLLIGANLGYIISKKVKNNQLNALDFYFIGASACTGAILKTPISGALFCAELPYSNYIRYRSLLPSLISSSIAYLIFCSFFGFGPLFRAELVDASFENYLGLIPLLIIFGIFMGIFILVVKYVMRGSMRRIKSYSMAKSFYWMLPLIGAVIYGAFLLFIIPIIQNEHQRLLIGPDVMFLSYIITSLESITAIHFLIYIFLFLGAMALSIGFYNSSGIILPLMLFGALVGSLFGELFYQEAPELFAVLGASVAVGAALNNPITAIIIIVEMTWEPFLFIPAGIATIIAYIFSGPNSIIPGQVEMQDINPQVLLNRI